ncbi:MAG: hypothetical protein R2809_06305 [Flavobacteriales bacterium]
MRYLFIILITLTFWSCKKEDGTPPSIFFTNNFSSTYNYGNSISFNIEASDNENLESITIKIYNLNNQPVLTPITLHPGTNSFQYEGQIAIDDIHLNSGQYYIQATASDGHNEAIQLKSFQINEAPKELIQIIGMNQNGGNSLNFFKLENSNWTSLYSLPLENFYCQFDNYDQRLLLAGNTTDGMSSVRLEDGAITGSSATPFSNSNSIWNDATWHPSSRVYWTACKDGSIRAYNSQAQTVNQFQIIGNDIPKQITVTDNFVIVYNTNLSNSQHRLDVYHKASGNIVHSTTLAVAVQQMEALSEDEIWIYQEGEEYKQNVYRIQGNYIDEWTNFRFTPAVNLNYSYISDAKLFLNFEDALRIYNLNGILISTGSSYPVTQLAHEVISNQLFVITNAEIKILNASTLLEINTLSHSDKVVFQYNK